MTSGPPGCTISEHSVSFVARGRVFWPPRSHPRASQGREVMGAEDARKLFVGGLSDSVTEEDLRALFESTGLGVIDVNVPRDRESGRPRGFGFVTLVSAE